ncbi:hypothetical protein RJ639_043484 [Escallonia herrerae]|uniref:Transposase (putative) gypsy type domain-containing protein n=1 Tax=Escallonia herrerae TaxID=1293975 RepID=A0AA89B102_9ASTE|nr:hypothetical protein RJ639_043484 [Escallonia herrerae]
MISDCLIKDVSVKRKGSSLRDGHGVERRDSEEVSLSFWRGGGDGDEVEERESSRVSAIWRTNGSERAATRVVELVTWGCLVAILCDLVALILVGFRKNVERAAGVLGSDGIVFGRLALCLDRVFGHNSARAESCSAIWHSARAECSGTILLEQNRVLSFGTLLGQSVRARLCSNRIVFCHLALCSGRVFEHDSARAESCSAIWHSAQAECSGTTLLGKNRPPTSQPSPSLPDQAEDEANPKPWYTADEKSSKMSTEDLVELLRECPLPEEPANYGTKYETGIYEEHVKSGYRLPLRPFAIRFFEHYHMAPRQLVPNGWRKLVGLIYLVQTSGYKPDATDFMRVYFEIRFVKGVANYPGWYYIHSRQRLLKGGPKSNKGWHSKYFFVGRSDKGKLLFDREWNPYSKDFKNPGKPTSNNLTKHILSHIKLRGGLSIDEPLSEQQLEWARIIPHKPVPVGALTPPPAPTISSTFPTESVPLTASASI